MAQPALLHHVWGLNFFSSMFDGISNKMYGTKNMTNAVLYFVPPKLSSVVKPNTFAFAMLTLIFDVSITPMNCI